MCSVEIEFGVPMPVTRGGVERSEYGIIRSGMMQLLIGSSFFMPGKDKHQLLYIRNAMWRLKSTYPLFQPWKITTRKVFENDTYGIRIWRTA
jgi:hypothetical protein